jgi:hypothetical protein
MRPGALRAATAKAAARLGKMRTRLSAGEKPNRRRMAALVTVYDAGPAKRRPHDVIAPPGGRHGDRPLRPGPKALAKWLAGSVRKDPAEVIAAAFDEAEARDPGHLRTWVVLVDGAEHQLDLIRAEAGRRGAEIHVVIDLIHVLEYIWKAAWSLHDAGDPAAEDWVAVKALAVLAGDSARASQEITAEASAASLPASRRAGADSCVRYLNARHEYLRYDQALAEGWPIATGVIEGACRHLPRRPPRHRRGQMGPGRRRSRPHPPRSDQQRRLRRVLELPPRPRAPAPLSRHQAGEIRTRRLSGYLTPEELHPTAFQVARVGLGQVRVFAGEHDSPVPEVLPALVFGPGMLIQALPDVVALSDVGERATQAVRVVTQQKVDAGPGCLRPLQQPGQV